MIKKEHIKKLREMNTDAEKLVRFFFFICQILKWLEASVSKDF